ncbi:UDP-N-acetylmuramoyl-tripeptide--D-alanyl-D-alanine ligase [Synechococcus sp. ATX 2A4]|uniref:UDP-N-acetylmuramoyl-tripeptide--D-alanyl-D- alanine ligase n=1 Tax=Synechococcus sp. ATX 2A4 TaxID=2823727 RepID=UPI0020CE836C|nr:UDP-N-acetylmuramoyl-tripeptide--D-alanyl-D-alanine ligase [Synechococcus sp. ATX 2A4]MCP9884030.1 UDP-N-acetylmuramoyl-tripeptide--D-alanyl-D-alanine ligase [Synechococcus sp. ATX 2A4]
MRLEQLVALWGDPIGGALDPALPLPRVCTDSRALQPGDLFVPLTGELHDGHRFLAQAAEAGALAALIDRTRAAERPAALPAWPVDDTQLAYQQLARAWREQLAAPVIAVTGSAGKTTTRELVRAVLAPLGPVLATSGNENNDVGVPLTLLKARSSDAAVVVEMGMRGLGEIERLSRCARPDVVVITNIGTAHIGRLGSREAIAQAKCEITAALSPAGLVVIPAGDPLLEQALGAVWSGRVRRVALIGDAAADVVHGSGDAAVLLGQIEGDPGAADGAWLKLLAGPGIAEGAAALAPVASAEGASTGEAAALPAAFRVPLPLPGRHNARNLLLALAVALELGVRTDQLQALQVEVPGGRSRRLQIGAVQVLDETYNASPEAVLAALDLLAAQPGRRFAALGTMLELGEQSEALHRAVARRAADLQLDGLVIVDGGATGAAMQEEACALPRLARVHSPAEAAEALLLWLQPGDQLLLKASRGVALERAIPLLAAQLAGAAGVVPV